MADIFILRGELMAHKRFISSNRLHRKDKNSTILICRDEKRFHSGSYLSSEGVVSVSRLKCFPFNLLASHHAEEIPA